MCHAHWTGQAKKSAHGAVRAEGQARGPLRGIAREARRVVLAQRPLGRD
jgi:hypothetical protein